MDNARQVVESADPRVKAALAEYMERVDRGEQVDREAFLATHAGIADELRSFIATSEELARLASPAADDSAAQFVSTRSLARRDQETVIPQRVQGDLKQSQSLGLPERFGRYRILKPLGSGAMGTVYLAEDTQLQRKVALKTPTFEQDESGELLGRFYREARSAATLRQPNICPVHDVGEIDGRHYITMAYIEGRPLSAYVRPDKPQSERQILMIVRKLALALQEAHDHNIIHRDLKPGNIMIDPKGEPIVMDFGLARKVHREDASRLTQSGMIVGSPAYMSPEQVEGDPDKLGPAADQYSLGVILYELLTGQLPFRGGVTAVIGAILTKEPTPVAELRAGINPRVAALCQRMMAKQANERFPSMKGVAEAIAGILKEAPSEATKETVRTVEKPAKPPVGAGAGAGAKPAKGTTSGAAASITTSNVASLFEAAQKCMRKHDYEQVVQMLNTIPEHKRNEDVVRLLTKARQLSDEVQFLLAEIDEALRVNDNETLGKKADELLKLKPGHHRAKQIKEELSRYGSGLFSRRGRRTVDGRRVGEGSWIPWTVIAVGVLVFGLTLWGITIYLRSGSAVVRVDINDPNIRFSVQGETITIEDNGQEIKLDPQEENVLEITYGDATFRTENTFNLMKGDNPAVSVTILDETLAARFGETVLGEWPVEPLADGTPPGATDDYRRYAQGSWTRLWDSDAAVQAALVEGTRAEDVTLQNGVLHVRDGGVTGPWPSRNIAVRLELRQDEGKGCFLSFRDNLGEPFMSYTNWANGYKNFGLGHNVDETFTEAGGHASVEDLRHEQFYEWMGVVDGETISIYINGQRLLQMNDDRIQTGLFVLWAGDSEVSVRDAEYRILDASATSSTGSAPPVATTSPVPADAVEFQGHSYKYFGEVLSWNEASQRCEQMGGHLPIVETAAENAFLTQLAERSFPAPLTGKESIWIGASDEAQEGTWRWSDAQSPAWGPATYTNWASNQPNNKNQQEHFATLKLSINAAGTWTDQPNVALANEQTVHWVCEWDELRTATAAPAAIGWTDLFNGRDLTGWHTVGDGGWTVQGGALTGAPGNGWIATDSEFTDFELELDFRLSAGTNSGVFLRIPEQGALNGGDFLEIQLIDEALQPNVETWQRTGAVYAVQGPTPLPNPAVEQWHQLAIRADGPEIVVSIDGTEVNRVNVETAPVLGPPKRDLRRPGGQVGFQHRGQPVAFRNIRIRELTPASAASPQTAQPLPRDEWIPLDPTAPRATSWNWGQPLRNPENKKWENGVLSLDNAAVAFNQIQAKDVSFRARVQFLEGNNMALVVRGEHGKGGVYALFDKQPDGRIYVAFLNTNSSSVVEVPDGYFDFQVDAVGEQVTIQVNGETVVRHRERQKLNAGHIEVTAYNARGMFRDMAVKILDEAPATAAAQNNWTDLFNGTDLTGWTVMRATNVNEYTPAGSSSGWEVRNGELICSDPNGSVLRSDRQYGDFVFQMEYKLPANMNTAVYAHVPESGLPWRTGLNCQLIDNDMTGRSRPIPPQNRNGSLVGVVAPDRDVPCPVDEWNSFELRCEGDRVQISLNGTLALDTTTTAHAQLADVPRSGYLCLSNVRALATGTAYRNVRIRELNTR